MNAPFRNVLPAFAPYTAAIDFESATEFWSSALAAAANAGDPLTPRFVAFIARTACSPSCLSSRTRRSDLVSAAADAWACVCMPAIGVLVLVRVAAKAATLTTTARAATPKSETKSLERMGENLPSGTISGADSPLLPIRFGLGFVQERGEPACAGPQGVA